MTLLLLFMLNWARAEVAPITNPAAIPSVTNQPFLTTFPQLKNYVYQEPPSGFYLGIGLSPIGILRDSMMFSGNFFEVHWLRDRYDWEVFNAAYSVTRASSSEFQSTRFTFRTSPKYRVLKFLSVGPVLGYELVSFSEVQAHLYKAPYISEPAEPFSSRGFIYGLEASETFEYGNGYLLKINELAYQESYSTTRTAQGWNYHFDDPNIQTDNSKISAGMVLMIEISFLY